MNMLIPTFRWMGEWIIAPLLEIEVADFQAWRKTNKRGQGRLLHPYVELRVGEHRVILDGYDDLWAFLDIIQPNMYRSYVNEAIKGRLFKEGIFFMEELKSFIAESQVQHIGFHYENTTFAIPNTRPSDSIKGAYLVKDMYDATCLREGYDLITPCRYKGKGIVMHDTIIDGMHPNLVVIQRNSHDSFNLHCIIYNPHGCDIRTTTAFFKIEKDIKDTLVSVKKQVIILHNTRWTNGIDNQDRIGMTVSERDSLEFKRFFHRV